VIDRLGAAGVEHHLFGFGVDQGRDLTPGLLQSLSGRGPLPGCRWRGCRRRFRYNESSPLAPGVKRRCSQMVQIDYTMSASFLPGRVISGRDHGEYPSHKRHTRATLPPPVSGSRGNNSLRLPVCGGFLVQLGVGHLTGLAVQVILDGGMQGVGPQVGTVELVGGRPPRASATSELVIFIASWRVLPRAISVIMLETAMAGAATEGFKFDVLPGGHSRL